MPINVAIVEDHDDIREGLALLINGSEGFRCVAAYASAESALENLPDQEVDVVLMDIGLPGMSGIECIRTLKAEYPQMQLMMLTVYEDDDKIYNFLVAGATGYILKKTPPARLLEAIQDLHNGGSPMSSQIARKVVQTFQILRAPSQATEPLSKREQEILSYLAKGHLYKEIAATLHISVETVRTHLRNIYEKLHARLFDISFIAVDDFDRNSCRAWPGRNTIFAFGNSQHQPGSKCSECGQNNQYLRNF